MAASVQVFGRWNAKTIHALRRPASEKRQGTKSRGVGHRGYAHLADRKAFAAYLAPLRSRKW
jgi:hypothetical protein